MLIKQIIEVFDLLDSPHACGEEVKAYLQSKGEDNAYYLPIPVFLFL